MKLFLIKIGQVARRLREEGMLSGIRNVASMLLRVLRPVRPADVLFVSGGAGDSALYRAYHVAEALESQGVSASVAFQGDPRLLSFSDRFSVFVFRRVLFTPSVARFIERVKARGSEIVFETDDLVYDPEFLRHMDFFRVMNPLERKLYENGVGGEILADPYVKVATASTPFLAEKLSERGKRTFVVPNRLSVADVRIADRLYGVRRDRNTNANGDGDGSVTIGYFSGAAGHDRDFATVTGPLAKIMERYPQVRLFVAGPLILDDAFEPFADRIERVPYAPRKGHFRNLAAVDIDIAPLEIGNPFCEGKSELKFFEAGVLGVPTVASATRTFREAITDGTDGFVAATDAEWEEKLGRLVADADLRRNIGEAARTTALSRYVTTNADDADYIRFLRETIARVSGEGR